MVLEFMKRYSLSLIGREMEIKATVSYHLTSRGVVKKIIVQQNKGDIGRMRQYQQVPICKDVHTVT